MGRHSRAGCSSSWWETIVIDINPGFSFALSGLLLGRDTPAQPSQPRRASLLLSLPVPAPCSAEEPIMQLGGTQERTVPESPSQLTDWKKRSWLVPGGRSIPLAGWSLPAQWEGNCEGNLSPARTRRNDPRTSGKLTVPLSDRAGCALTSPALACAGRVFPCCPPAPYAPQPLMSHQPKSPRRGGHRPH